MGNPKTISIRSSKLAQSDIFKIPCSGHSVKRHGKPIWRRLKLLLDKFSSRTPHSSTFCFFFPNSHLFFLVSFHFLYPRKNRTLIDFLEHESLVIGFVLTSFGIPSSISNIYRNFIVHLIYCQTVDPYWSLSFTQLSICRSNSTEIGIEFVLDGVESRLLRFAWRACTELNSLGNRLAMKVRVTPQTPR